MDFCSRFDTYDYYRIQGIIYYKHSLVNTYTLYIYYIYNQSYDKVTTSIVQGHKVKLIVRPRDTFIIQCNVISNVKDPMSHSLIPPH